MEEKQTPSSARLFTAEEKAALVKRFTELGEMQVKDYVPEDNLLAYLELKEIQLLLDRAACEISSNLFLVSHAMAKCEREAESRKDIEFSEYKASLKDIHASIRENNVKILQVMSKLGKKVDDAYRLVHPEIEEACPGDIDSVEQTNTKLG